MGDFTGRQTSSVSAEQSLKALKLEIPDPPKPFGTCAEALQTGNLLFLTGMLPTEGHAAKFVGRVGAELDVEGDESSRASRWACRWSWKSFSRFEEPRSWGDYLWRR